MTKLTIAQAVRHYRAKQGFTIEAAAKACGIRKATWIDLEHGRSNPRLSTLEAVAYTLNVPVSFLFSGVSFEVTPKERREFINEKMEDCA